MQILKFICLRSNSDAHKPTRPFGSEAELNTAAFEGRSCVNYFTEVQELHSE